MSDVRKPVKIIKLLGFNGKKIIKIELFSAKQFRSKGGVSRCMFSPLPPLDITLRDEYMSSMYRIRINGVWDKSKGQYSMYTFNEVVGKFILTL